jgi:hypothetical protein
MLSVPLQQVARYCKYEHDRVTPMHADLLNELFFVSCVDLGEGYVPETADNVKMYFLYNPSSQQLLSFGEIWFHFFMKRPDIYIDAFLENYYGYIYPLRREYKDGIAWFSIQYSPEVSIGFFNIYFLDHRTEGRLFIENSVNFVRSLPILELFFNVGTYLWILIVSVLIMIRKHQSSLIIVIVPLLLTSMICFLSPVNAYIRYMLPVMVSLPLILLHLATFENIES